MITRLHKRRVGEIFNGIAPPGWFEELEGDLSIQGPARELADGVISRINGREPFATWRVFTQAILYKGGADVWIGRGDVRFNGDGVAQPIFIDLTLFSISSSGIISERYDNRSSGMIRESFGYPPKTLLKALSV